MLNWQLTPLMRELIDGIERLGGGGRESVIAEEASSRGESGDYGADAHFAKALRELEARGILRREMVITARYWWMTEAAWRERGHRGPAPAFPQTPLFS